MVCYKSQKNSIGGCSAMLFWHFCVVLSLKLIELKFEKFDVERDNYCRYDFVAVFNGGEVNDAQRIGKYCGDSPPA